MSDKYIFENEPSEYRDKKDLKSLLRHFYEVGGSDLYLCHQMEPTIKIHGDNYKVTDRLMSKDDMESILNALYKSSNAESLLMNTGKINGSYEIKLEDQDNLRIRFRYNVVGVEYLGQDCFQITIRLISSMPLSISELGVEEEIVDNFTQSNGIVVITGPTGTGKTTLMSSCVRNILENKETSIKIDSYESPIEFIYDYVEWNKNLIFQTQVPDKIRTFAEAIEESLRRNPSIIMIGESRDVETINAALNAAQTGHGVVTTTHTSDVATTLSRMVNVYSPSEKISRQRDLLDSIKMIVSQKLIKSKNGKRVAIKEWWIPKQEEIDLLYTIDPNNIVYELRKIVYKNKRSFKHDLARKFKKELITKEVFDYEMKKL